MYNSQVAARDPYLSFHSPLKPTKNAMEKSREAMDSELYRHNQITRFASAPSALLAELLEEECKDFLPTSSSPEADAIIERFMSNSAATLIGDKVLDNQRGTQFTGAEVPQQGGFRHPSSQIMYPPPSVLSHTSGAENSFKELSSMGMDTEPVKTRGNCSNLMRHSSSPAGLFSNIMEGYGARSAASYAGDDARMLKNRTNFLSRQGSSPALMPQISETGSKSIGGDDDEHSIGKVNNGGQFYMPRYPVSSWHDTPIVSANLSGSKLNRDNDGKIIAGLSPSDGQNGEGRGHPSGLSHQFSLPKTSAEMAAVEKFLQLHDSVPCKIRAKRGCATHPRSIAERVRRTKISERMRKLQELVPNMDKQTNTADMLDLAVDYIKDLQKQVKLLSENRARCTCSQKPKPYPTAG